MRKRSWKRWGVVLDGRLIGGSVWAIRADVQKDARDIGERAEVVRGTFIEDTLAPAKKRARGRK